MVTLFYLFNFSSPRDRQQACSHQWNRLSWGPLSGEPMKAVVIPAPFLQQRCSRRWSARVRLGPTCFLSGLWADTVLWQSVLGESEVSQCLSTCVCSLTVHLPGWRTWQQKGLSLFHIMPSFRYSSCKSLSQGRDQCLLTKHWGCFSSAYLTAT